jgi:hypothetical protein
VSNLQHFQVAQEGPGHSLEGEVERQPELLHPDIEPVLDLVWAHLVIDPHTATNRFRANIKQT